VTELIDRSELLRRLARLCMEDRVPLFGGELPCLLEGDARGVVEAMPVAYMVCDGCGGIIPPIRGFISFCGQHGIHEGQP